MFYGRRFHRGFTAAEKTELWDRSEATKAIGRAFGKPSSSIYSWWLRGIRPAEQRGFPAGIDACGTRGDFQRRYGTSIGTIDRQVAWPLTSTVSREMSRNGGCDRYRAALADA